MWLKQELDNEYNYLPTREVLILSFLFTFNISLTITTSSTLFLRDCSHYGIWLNLENIWTQVR